MTADPPSRRHRDDVTTAALTGKLRVGGRKPWLDFAYPIRRGDVPPGTWTESGLTPILTEII